LASRAATSAGGRFILRIEDIDRIRCKLQFEQSIYDDLTWLGLRWETPVRRQSEHLDDYETALEQLRSKGLLYRCFRTRKDIAQAAASAPHGPETPFRGAPLTPAEEASRLTRGEPFAWRLSLIAAKAYLGADYDRLSFIDLDAGGQLAKPDTAGDVVLARKDVGVAYHLACVVDDALQGVNHVIRGEDLREAVHIQRLLQALLGLKSPQYRHHRLVLGADGKRLAKRAGHGRLSDLREQGVPPAGVLTMVGLMD